MMDMSPRLLSSKFPLGLGTMFQAAVHCALAGTGKLAERPSPKSEASSSNRSGKRKKLLMAEFLM
jgi:hypothetical protein